VENAYIDEKEDACSALGELALNTGYGLHMDTNELSSQLSRCACMHHYDAVRCGGKTGCRLLWSTTLLASCLIHARALSAQTDQMSFLMPNQ